MCYSLFFDSHRFWELEKILNMVTIGVCKPSPEPTTLTGTDPPTPPLALTDGVDADDRNANRAPMSVR